MNAEKGKGSGFLEQIREPLVKEQTNMGDAEGGTSDQASKEGHPWMVYLSTFVAVCGSYAFGSCAGYSSPTQSEIREDLSLTLAEYAVFGSILTFGAMIGAIISGPMADIIGRKGAMRVSAAFCIAGWLAIFFAKEAVALYLGRLATGYGMGAFSFVNAPNNFNVVLRGNDKVPIFIAEIAPKNCRGMLTTMNQIMICGAVSVSFIIGTVLTWRVLALTGTFIIYAIINALAVVFVIAMVPVQR